MLCEDSCPFIMNGVCQDGGPDAKGASCGYGKDCLDCGPRTFLPPPPVPLPQPPPVPLPLPPPPPPPPYVRHTRPRPAPPRPPPRPPLQSPSPHPPPIPELQPPQIGDGDSPDGTEALHANSVGGSVFSGLPQRWGVDSFDLNGPPPAPPAEAAAIGAGAAAQALVDGVAKSAGLDDAQIERMHTIATHGAAAAGVLASKSAQIGSRVGKAASGGAVIAGGAMSQAAQQALQLLRSSAGLTTEDVEILGLVLGLGTGLCCLCCCYCMYRQHCAPRKGGRVSRMRRALPGSARKGSHRALPLDDYSDDDDF